MEPREELRREVEETVKRLKEWGELFQKLTDRIQEFRRLLQAIAVSDTR